MSTRPTTPDHWLAAKRALDQGDLDAADAHLARLKGAVPAENPPQYINVPYLKGTVLRLTMTEYAIALRRGKQWQRGERTAKREEPRV